MTPEERQMLGGLFQRVNSAAATQRDPEAESFITDAVRAAPHAPYVLAQTVLVQQQALEAAANRISQLEAAAQQGAEQSQEHGSFLGNLGKTIFGGGASAPPRPDSDPQAYQRAAPPPPRGYAPPPPQGGYPPPPQDPRHKAIRSSLAHGASPSLRPAAEAFCKTQLRPRRAWPAASSLAICWAACLAAMAAAVSLAAGQALPD